MRKVQRHAAEETEQRSAIENIDRVMQRLANVGLIDDRAYAERRAEIMQRQGKSTRAVQADLLARGIGHEIANDVVRALEQRNGDPNLSAAIAYAKKRRLGPYREEDREAYRNEDATKLLRRGFEWDVVERVMRAPAA
jgi:regulatory protein